MFAAMSVIWGIPYLLIKIAVEGVSVPVLVLARTAIGAAVLLPLALSRTAWAPVLRHWRPVLVFAFFEIIAAWLLLSDAERHISSSLTGLLIAASPIIAAVLDRLTGGEARFGGKRIIPREPRVRIAPEFAGEIRGVTDPGLQVEIAGA